VHGRSCRRGLFTTVCPLFHNLFIRSTIVFTGCPIGTLSHFGKGRLGIKVTEEFMDETGTGNVSLTGTIYIVFVGGFIESNVIITMMMVDFG
jgi:hypothetical protein